jgi:class 3 adenylate cyclase
LPTGTVAFLMTDIEGSTRLAAAVHEAFPRVLDDHFRLLEEAISAQHGTLVSSEGDSVFAVFPTARQAVAAAAAAQGALASHPWPQAVPVTVRMGIHVGEAVRGGRDYTGLEVHRTARIANAGWGGQVLVSEAARALCGDALPEGIQFRDLGTHVLRDLPRAERLHQLLAPGLASEFPPVRAESVEVPTNLPTALTRFVGRRREVEEIRSLVASERLVTLTGPGGTGKTRLSVEAARTMVPHFPDGAWFVELDAVRDPELVIPTIAQTLGVPEKAGHAITGLLSERLADARVLLVLDNLEQVAAAGPDIAGLVGATSKLAVLASSREPLAVGGERVYRV